MEKVVAPVFQMPPEFPVRITLSPVQIIGGPVAVITDVEGSESTMTLIILEVSVSQKFELVTKYEPVVFTTSIADVDPVFQVPPALPERIRLSPRQIVSLDRFDWMTEATGSGSTLTLMLLETRVEQELAVVTKYSPLVVTTIDDVVAPVFQTPPTLPESVTLPGSQNEIVSDAVMTEIDGGKSTVTIIWFELTFPQLSVLVTKYSPVVFTTMDDVVAPVLQVPLTFPERITLSPRQNVIASFAVMMEGMVGALTLTSMWLDVTLPQELVLTTK
jgi:hypothetical protein